MNILITGTSNGIGRATALLFLERGHNIYGIDIQASTISQGSSKQGGTYTHFRADITGTLPELPQCEVVIANAGVQQSGRDIA